MSCRRGSGDADRSSSAAIYGQVQSHAYSDTRIMALLCSVPNDASGALITSEVMHTAHARFGACSALREAVQAPASVMVDHQSTGYSAIALRIRRFGRS